MNKKILLLSLISMFMLSMTFATIVDNNIQFATFDNVDLNGTSPIDVTGSNNVMTNNGATTGVTGIVNQAFDFDGTSDYVALGRPIDPIASANMTISIWFNTSKDYSAARGFLVTNDLSGSPDFGIAIGDTGLSASNKVIFGAVNLGDSIISTSTVNDGQWHHIVATKELTNGSLWLDGVYQGSFILAGDWENSQDWVMGMFRSNFYFDGKIDAYGVWDRKINDSEIAELYNTGNSVQYPFGIPSVVNVSEAFNSIKFLDETIVNNTLTTTNNLYWNLQLNESLGLTNFSVNFNGTGFEKIIDLPYESKIINDYNRTSEQDQMNGFIRYNNTIYMIASDNLNKNYNQIIKISSDYKTVLDIINLTTLPSPSGFNQLILSDITVKDNFFYLLRNNGILHKFNINLTDTGITYNLSSLANGTSFGGKVQGIFYDEVSENWVHGIASNREWHIYNEDFTKYLAKYDVSNDPPLNTEINRYTSMYDNYYYMYGNDVVFKLDKHFIYQNESWTILNFSESDTCTSVFQGSFRFEDGEFIGLCWKEKLNDEVQFQRFDNNLTLISNNYATTYENNNIADGDYTIKFQTTNSTYTFNTSTYHFSIDATDPVINNSIPSTINTYFLNISDYVSCNDANLKTCNITWANQNTTHVNITYPYNITYNGNQSYNIFAEDIAGNIVNKSGVLFVNPYAYFRFNNSGTLLTDYTFGGTLWTNNTAKFTLYNSILDVGSNNTIAFSKVGYISETFTQEVLNNSRINTTYDVKEAEIFITIRDKDTLSKLIGVNFSMQFIGDVGLTTSTITSNKSITSLLIGGDYELIVSSDLYTTESNFFTFTNQELLELDVYVTNATTTGTVIVLATGSTGELAVGFKVQALQWDTTTSQYIVVSEATTDSSGKGTLNVILNTKSYIFRLIGEGKTKDSPAETITADENGKIIPLSLQSGVLDYDKGLSNYFISSTESYNNVTNISSIVMNYHTEDGTNMVACINVYKLLNNVERLDQSYCTNESSSGVYPKNFLINTSQFTNIKTELLIGNSYYTYESYQYFPTLSFQNSLLSYGFYFFVMLLLYLLSIWLGLILFENIYIAIMLIVISGFVGFNLVPSIMTNLVATAFGLMGSLTIWAGYKKK